MNLLKAIICHFKGHIINPDESIVRDIVTDKRNWLCKCHRCGLYDFHSAISGKSVTITESDALREKEILEHEIKKLKMMENEHERN